MNENWFSWRFLHLLEYTPDGKRGYYCKMSQRKRRKNNRRCGKRR